jgi:phosphoglycerol geranylgeranyltransferase
VGEVDLVKQNDIETAVGYALAAQYLGMDFFYLEAGSGAHNPVSDEMISAVKASIDIPLLVGGGIKDAITAANKIKAGADVVVTGTKLEEEENLKQALSDIIKSIEE